jgi:hypothetical protein
LHKTETQNFKNHVSTKLMVRLSYSVQAEYSIDKK